MVIILAIYNYVSRPDCIGEDGVSSKTEMNNKLYDTSATIGIVTDKIGIVVAVLVACLCSASGICSFTMKKSKEYVTAIVLSITRKMYDTNMAYYIEVVYQVDGVRYDKTIIHNQFIQENSNIELEYNVKDPGSVVVRGPIYFF